MTSKIYKLFLYMFISMEISNKSVYIWKGTSPENQLTFYTRAYQNVKYSSLFYILRSNTSDYTYRREKQDNSFDIAFWKFLQNLNEIGISILYYDRLQNILPFICQKKKWNCIEVFKMLKIYIFKVLFNFFFFNSIHFG